MEAGDETADLLERAKAGDVPAVSARGDGDTAKPGWARGLALVAVLAGLSGAVALLLSGGDESDPFVYSQTIDEAIADPSAHLGRTLRLEGMLKSGSVLFREEPCEWRFVLEGEAQGREMPVQFPQCVVPDTFRDGMGISVVVEGQLREDGTFIASQVIPRCPSRYEMEQRQQAGEATPHGPMPEQSSLGAPRPPS